MFRLTTLGSVDLRAPDNRALDVVLAQPKRVALLVYLAAARSAFHRRDRLVALFWPELDDARARDALSQALRFLRKSFGADVVLTRGVDEVGVDREHVWCDAVALRAAVDEGRAEDALRIYRGDFLDGFFVEDASGFEEWMEGERAALRQLAARGARALAERNDGEGAHTAAVGWGKRAVELAPDDERAFRRLLALFERAGDRAGALQAYDDFARRLRVEFGAEPADETRRLLEEIRRSASGGAAQVPPGASAEGPAALGQTTTSGLSDDDALCVGASLSQGRYLIEGVLGSGGMATVYVAHDVRHDRRVAIKVLRADIGESIGTSALLREIRIAAGLQHPHIVPLFDSGESNGRVFFVMPHVVGESLRARLQRDPVIPIDTVLRVARDVADALVYAHRQGIIHRDIKPDNILISGDAASGELHAVVADFGIAKAIGTSRTRDTAPTETLTALGGFVGTPGYMAPEQAAGGRVDYRCDLYAWGVVVCEMLLGEHPFPRGGPAPWGAGGQSPVDASSIRARRPEAPERLALLVAQCLADAASDRPRDAGALITALDGEPVRAGSPPDSGGAAAVSTRPNARQWRGIAIGVAAIALISAGTWLVKRSALWGAAAVDSTTVAATIQRLDTTAYLVVSADSSAAGASDEMVQRVRDGMSRWIDIRVERLPAGSVAGTRGQRGLDVRQVAESLGVGRYVTIDERDDVDSTAISASVYDTQTGVRIARATRKLAADGSPHVTLQALADSVLFRTLPEVDRVDLVPGTRSREARQAYFRAHAALAQGRIDLAEDEFFTATRHDAAYAHALVWLATMRSWMNVADLPWVQLVQQAVTHRAKLSGRDSVLLTAMEAAASGRMDFACAPWQQLTRIGPHDYAAWYGLADCLRRDQAVVSTGTGAWRFRTSHYDASVAYERAFNLRPGLVRGVGNGPIRHLQDLLYTSSAELRNGAGVPPATGRFRGYPILVDDTVTFVVVPEDDALTAPLPEAVGEAIQRERLRFRDIARLWAAEGSNDAEAAELLAISSEMLGDDGAIELFRRARTLARATPVELRIAAREVLVRTKLSLPSDLAGLRHARLLADSLLRANPPSAAREVGLLASLAGLIGRADLAAAYARMSGGERDYPSFARHGAALVAFASMGGPTDSLRMTERLVADAIPSLPLSLRTPARRDWLSRAGALAFPDVALPSVTETRETGLRLGDLVAASWAGDTLSVRRRTEAIAESRRWLRPADIMTDGLLPEAAALARSGDPAAAIRRIDPTLRAIRYSASQDLGTVWRTGPLVRVMALRADLAHRQGDIETARVWSRAVIELWSRSDPYLRPTLDRMRQLAR